MSETLYYVKYSDFASLLAYSVKQYAIQYALSSHTKGHIIDFQVQLSLNAGQKYHRMLKGGAFCNSFDLHKATICHLDLCFVYF